MEQATIDKLRGMLNSTNQLVRDSAKEKLEKAGISLSAETKSSSKLDEASINKLKGMLNSTNKLVRDSAKEKLEKAGISTTTSKPKAEPKTAKPKAEKPKAEPKAKVEKPSTKEDDDYCNELITKEKERKAKAKANAIKRANAPKKTPSTKNKEAVAPSIMA